MVRRGDNVKEAYLTEGNPRFVRSNANHERLGEYLVARGVLTKGELTRALSVMPHFGGRLGDTLVGLDLMTPMEAFHHLTGQVHHKLVDLCTWSSGTYQWFEGQENPWPALPLALDTLRIIGDGTLALAPHLIRSWLDEHRSATLQLQAHPPVDFAHFGIGQRLNDVYRAIDGDATVADLVAPMSTDASRLEVARAAYLLVEAGLATCA